MKRAVKAVSEYFSYNGKIFVLAPLPVLPDPIPEDELRGVKVYAHERRVFARGRGDKVMRPTGADLQQTNMTLPFFYIKDGEVVFAKYIMRLDKRYYWVDVWREMLGDHNWEVYCQPRFGFEDTNKDPTDPVSGEFKQQTIDCGLNLRELDGDPFWTHKGQFVKVKSIDYYSSFQPEYNYTDHPEWMVKQTIVGTSSTQPVYYIANQRLGDLVWPNLRTWPLIQSMADLEVLPDLPHRTSYAGIPVTIEAYNFTESTTHGLMYPDNASQGEPGWRVIETMEVSGLGSATYDRRLFVVDWIDTPAPPVKGWTRDKAGLDNALLKARLMVSALVGR